MANESNRVGLRLSGAEPLTRPMNWKVKVHALVLYRFHPARFVYERSSFNGRISSHVAKHHWDLVAQIPAGCRIKKLPNLQILRMKDEYRKIANRGEIAVRIIHACRDMHRSRYMQMTILAACMSNLSMGLGWCNRQWNLFKYSIEIAKKSKATMVHPGYGFSVLSLLNLWLMLA